MDPYLAANLIGFTTGLVISILLLVLTVRAAKLPGTPIANLLCAACSLLWNFGGLLSAIQNPVATPAAGPGCIPMAIQFTGAAVWPIPMLAVWRHLAVERWQSACWQLLVALASISASVITLSAWAVAGAGPTILPNPTLKEFTAYSASFLLACGAVMLLRGRSVSRALRFSSWIVLFGLLATTLSVLLQTSVRLPGALDAIFCVTSMQSVLLIIFGTFFLFARFRFSDLFIRYTVRILLASLFAVAFVFLTEAPVLQRLLIHTQFSKAMRLFLITIGATELLMCFVPIERWVGRLVNRRIFHAPDYRNAARDLGDQLRSLYVETEVTAAVETAVRNTLALEDVRSITLTKLPVPLWPAEVHDGEIAEIGCGSPLASLLSAPQVELLVPVRAGGTVISVLAISPGAGRRGLVSQEVIYLRSVAAQYGSRLDLLRLERDMADRQNRESLLLQQVTEAELRALRAQINPHFLFNSLNTIANLIVTNPGRAETMTLRLARVFRHLLAQASRPLVPVREEIEFLRTYLEIEEARFGNRLQVEIDVAPEIAREQVPSLILQPVVENALKHGLAPKPGQGRLWITARAQGDQLCLAVEDDGVGPGRAGLGNANGVQPHGVGLTNITQRLTTLYQDRAWLTLEPREPAGTRVTVTLPRDRESNADAKPHC